MMSLRDTRLHLGLIWLPQVDTNPGAPLILKGREGFAHSGGGSGEAPQLNLGARRVGGDPLEPLFTPAVTPEGSHHPLNIERVLWNRGPFRVLEVQW